MRTRRHHNNKGTGGTKVGKTSERLRKIAKKLGIPFTQGKKGSQEV